jgi:hypothetical protein
VNGFGSPRANSPIALAKRNKEPFSAPPGLACASQYSRTIIPKTLLFRALARATIAATIS